MAILPAHRLQIQAAFETALNDGDRLAVTGATGWLGRVVTQMALRAGLTPEDGRLRLFASRNGEMSLGEGRTVSVEALDQATPLTGDSWIIIHLAGLGKERTGGLSAEAFVNANSAILEALLRLSESAAGARLVYSSSGAVYGTDGVPPRLDQEPYGHVKGLQEATLSAHCRQKGWGLQICRVFNVGGPCGNKQDLYALSSLAQAGLDGGPIGIRAAPSVFRSYVHVEELFAVLLHALADEQSSGTIDTAGVEIVEVGDIAAEVCRQLDLSPQLIARKYQPEQPASWYVGDGRAYQVALRRAGLAPVRLDMIIADTLADQRASGGA